MRTLQNAGRVAGPPEIRTSRSNEAAGSLADARERSTIMKRRPVSNRVWAVSCARACARCSVQHCNFAPLACRHLIQKLIGELDGTLSALAEHRNNGLARAALRSGFSHLQRQLWRTLED